MRPKCTRSCKAQVRWDRKKIEGIPQLYWYGTQGDYSVVVMELLGSSLDQLHRRLGKRFSIPTTATVAIQIVKLGLLRPE